MTKLAVEVSALLLMLGAWLWAVHAIEEVMR